MAKILNGHEIFGLVEEKKSTFTMIFFIQYKTGFDGHEKFRFLYSFLNFANLI
jgi:hypothetical protein